MSKVFWAPLLPFLSACLYGDAASFFMRLDEAERTLLESQCGAFGMTAWLYRFLSDVLPDERRLAFQKKYQTVKVQALAREHELNRLCGVLRENGLRFALIKGADLAYRLYPDPALRRYGDWDVWFYPDDCEKALETLAEDGWEVPAQYSDFHEAVRKTKAHHFSPHVKGSNKLEPHFSLPNFSGIDPHAIWEYTVECPGGGQHLLSPELNLLILARHAAMRSYFHVSVPKLLADIGVIVQKETVDFAKLRSMAAQWRLPYPGDLFAAFPEFFPAETVAGFGADPVAAARFRTLFEMRDTMTSPESVSLALNQFYAGGDKAHGIWAFIRGMGPNKIRVCYKFPEHGAWGRVSWGFVRYSFTWAWRVLTSLVRRDKSLRDYCHLVNTLEHGATGEQS